MDGADQERSLVNPSKKNILHVLSGAWSNESINNALNIIDEKQIVLKGPDDVYEVSSSAMPPEKVQATKDNLYLQYEDVSVLFNTEYTGLKSDITKCISNAEGFNRITEFSFVWGGHKQQISIESKLQRAFTKEYAAKIAIVVFRGETPSYDKKSSRAELPIESQKNMIQQLSEKDTMQNVVFVVVDVPLGSKGFEGIIDAKARALVATDTQVEDPAPYNEKAERWMKKWYNDIIDGAAEVIFRGERVNTPTFRAVSNSGVLADLKRVFPYGAESLKRVANASTGWKQVYARRTVEKICCANNRGEIENFVGAESAVLHLLKDKHGNWIFDEMINYIGQYDVECPMTVLIKAIDDKIAELRNNRNRTVVDIGQEFRFLAEPPYGYYNNYICMAAVALAFRRFTQKMYLSDQGNLVTKDIMKDIVNAAFYYWLDNKQNRILRVRFSTADEKELIDMIQSIFKVEGDGISETKWKMRDSFVKKYKSPLWALKYVVEKGAEFNSVIDSLFALANATGDSITQEDVTELLEGLKKQKASIELTLEKVEDSTCFDAFVDKCLKEVKFNVDDYSNLKSYLEQNLPDAVVFWREDAVIQTTLRKTKSHQVQSG